MTQINPKESTNKVHMVKKGSSSKNASKRLIYSGKKQKNKKKQEYVCYFCNEPGYFKKDCKLFKKSKGKSVSGGEGNLIAVISKINVWTLELLDMCVKIRLFSSPFKPYWKRLLFTWGMQLMPM